MKRPSLTDIFVGLIIGIISAIGLTAAFATPPTPYSISSGGSAQLTRPCAFDAVAAQGVSAVTGSSTAISTATIDGTVRVYCDTKSYFHVGAKGATGPTAGTGDQAIAGDSPEYFYSPGVIWGFLSVTAAGRCTVADCK